MNRADFHWVRPTTKSRIAYTMRRNGQRQGAWLDIIAGHGYGQTHTLDQHTSIIGRADDADIQVGEYAVSRRHAMILTNGRAHLIRDLGSTNGTRVNGLHVVEKLLRDGDTIEIGGTAFQFRLT